MKPVLHNCGRIEVRKSGVEGYGVFAVDSIQAGEVLEEVPFILFPKYTSWGKEQYEHMVSANIISDREKYIENVRHNFGFKDPEKYYFRWEPPAPNVAGGEPISYVVLPLGYGPIYNTSNTDNNAGWKIVDKLFVFVAEKDIAKDEEIKTFYGYFLDEKGAIINVEPAFFMGLEYDSGEVFLKGLRCSFPEHIKKISTDPNYIRLGTFIARAKDRLVKIKRLEAGQYSFDVPASWPLSFYYQKLLEFSSSKFPTTKLFIEFVDEADGLTKKETINLPNR